MIADWNKYIFILYKILKKKRNLLNNRLDSNSLRSIILEFLILFTIYFYKVLYKIDTYFSLQCMEQCLFAARYFTFSKNSYSAGHISIWYSQHETAYIFPHILSFCWSQFFRQCYHQLLFSIINTHFYIFCPLPFTMKYSSVHTDTVNTISLINVVYMI